MESTVNRSSGEALERFDLDLRAKTATLARKPSSIGNIQETMDYQGIIDSTRVSLSWITIILNKPVNPLVNCYITMENHHAING